MDISPTEKSPQGGFVRLWWLDKINYFVLYNGFMSNIFQPFFLFTPSIKIFHTSYYTRKSG